MLSEDTARSSSCHLLLSFLFNVNIIPATLSSSELAVVVVSWGWVVVQVVGGKFRYRGKCPAISRVVASGSPEARRKGLDDQVERSPPEALRLGGKVEMTE